MTMSIMSSEHSYGRYAYAYRLDNSTQHGGWKSGKTDVEEVDISMQLSQLGFTLLVPDP